MGIDKWNIKYDWVQSDDVWIQQDRNEQYTDNRFISINDIYFKNQKYLSGVSYTYVNKLGDIYKRDLLTGDGYSLLNMYNEYDIVDRVLKNIQMVDVASTSNIDITKQWRKINNIQLKSGQFVLLSNQISEYENDVYKVTPQYFLENAGFINTREMSERFSVSVKLGTYKDKQFYLLNNGEDFPITGEPKHFIEGNSFILKHILKYNLYNTSSNSAVTSKIIFTDYEIARKQLSVNSSLYQDISYSFPDATPDSDYYQILHHHDSFIIRTGVTNDRVYSGVASQISNNADPISGGTTISGISPFVANVGDYINVEIMSGSSVYLTMNTSVKYSDSDLVVLSGLIPNRILSYTDGMTLNIYNYNIASTWSGATYQLDNNTPYSQFINASGNFSSSYHDLTLSTQEYEYDKYFDYSDLVVKVNGIGGAFNSSNNYISYNLYERMNLANPFKFTSSYSFFNTFNTNLFSWTYTDDSRIKLSFTYSGDTTNFREYTYVYLNNDVTKKVMIWKIEGSDIYLDKPSTWLTGTGVSRITNIDGLFNISEILQEVYVNVDYDWYISKKDNIRRSICSQYAQLLSEDVTFQRNVTGLLYENEFNEFVLKLYDLENDTQLSFTTIELMYLGADRKTRIPVPINREQLEERTTYTYDWDVLDCGLIYTGSTTGDLYYTASGSTEVFDFGLDVVLGGPNDPPLMFTIVDGNG